MLNDALTHQNYRAERSFSAFNGISMAMSLMAAPVMAATGPDAGPVELTVLMSAFPMSVLLGPFWATLGARVGMQQLVLGASIVGAILMILVGLAPGSWPFTICVAGAQVMLGGARMGQTSLYPILYDRVSRGRVLGRFMSWTFATMVPSILLAGWLLDVDRTLYRLIYPLAGCAGLIGCLFYARIRLPALLPSLIDTTPIRHGFRGVASVLRSDRAYRVYQIAFFFAGSAFFMSSHVVLMLIRDRLAFSPFGLSLWLGVIPQLALAITSPIWGSILDRIGFARCRLLISFTLCAYLACYWFGIVTGLAWLVCLGCILFGVTNGGGQVTWVLGPGHYAPHGRDVPIYSGVHFVLNGLRGLLAPGLGSLCWMFLGSGAVIVAFLTCALSIPFLIQLRRLEVEESPEAPSGPSGVDDYFVGPRNPGESSSEMWPESNGSRDWGDRQLSRTSGGTGD